MGLSALPEFSVSSYMPGGRAKYDIISGGSKMKAKTKRVLAAVLAAVMILPGMPYGDGVLVASASNVGDSLETDKEVPEEEKVSEDENAGNEEKPDVGNGEVTDTPDDGDAGTVEAPDASTGAGDEAPGAGDAGAKEDEDAGETQTPGGAEEGETPDAGEIPGGGKIPRIANRQQKEMLRGNVSIYR